MTILQRTLVGLATPEDFSVISTDVYIAPETKVNSL